MERLTSFELLVTIIACAKEGNKEMGERAEKILEKRKKEQEKEKEKSGKIKS